MSDKNVTVSSEDTTDLPPVLSRTVALTEIQRDPALRVRVALSRERIAEFQAVMSNKDTQPLPPMECTEVGGELFLSDGWHRYEAHTALKHKTVEVRVRKGSKADAFRAACMADRYCALPRTKADKNRAVTLALGMNLWRDRFIADMLAVSPNFVGQVRKRIQVDTPADNTPKIGRDGKLHPPKTDEQKRKYLPPLASGEWLAAFGLTEAGSGSDAAAMQTFAVRKGDKYILNGSKRFITNGGLAQVNSIFALTDPDAGTRGISAFIVERDFPGFSVGRIEDKMGIKGSQTAELIFTDCEVPAENLLGREGDGFKYAMMTLDRTRPGVAAQAMGIAQGALDLAVSYSKQRIQFKKPIAENQGIQFMLAGMATKVEAARLLVYNAAELIDRGEPNFSKYSSMAKLYASDIAMEVTGDAVQILGGYGYMKEYPAERMMRDAKITQIYEGTNQIQLLVIARALLGEN